MLTEENVREQSVINCKTVFVVTELGFRAFLHFFLNSQVKKSTAARK